MRTALLLAFFTGARVSNYAATSQGARHVLRWSDVRWGRTEGKEVPKTVRLAFRSSKTAQPGASAAKLRWLVRLPDAVMCAATHLWVWALRQRQRGLYRPTLPVFAISRHEVLTAEVVNAFLAARAAVVGLAPAQLRSHSLRVSFVSNAFAVGAAQREVYRQAGFVDPTANVAAEGAYALDGVKAMRRLQPLMVATTKADLGDVEIPKDLQRQLNRD